MGLHLVPTILGCHEIKSVKMVGHGKHIQAITEKFPSMTNTMAIVSAINRKYEKPSNFLIY